MPKFHVAKSILIQAPVEDVHAVVRDFRRWPEWSPWLITEPSTRVDYSADGRSYAWDGKITGCGQMAIARDDAPRSIDYQLTFLKPWKSVNSARFDFKERDGGTEVIWTMEGSLPFFMFWMKSMMTAYIGADYQRGLMMLKAVIETGDNPSKLEFTGRQSFPGCRYVGVRSCCPIAEISASMQQDMQKLMSWISQGGGQPDGKPFSICHQWNPVRGTTEYTLGFPLDSVPSGLSGGFVSGGIPACEVYQIRHTGPYRFLGNAWAAGAMRDRTKVFTANKRIDPFEIYLNDPTGVPESDLVTVLHFPVR